jgi:plasmid stabilization system protein ParE
VGRASNAEVKIDLAQKALRDILREARWWLANRGDAPLLFEKELAEALEKIRKWPEAPKVYRVKGRRITRRVLMPGTGCHVYYRVQKPDIVRVVSVWGASRGDEPKL